MKLSFNRMEWAGSLGDLGTLLPLAVAMVMVNGLNPAGVFLAVAGMYILGGLYFRVPIAVQPMKVIGAYAVASGIPAVTITGAGILVGAILCLLALTGLMDRLGKAIPPAVVRGVQLSTGILLLARSVEFLVGTSSFQRAGGGSEPFLAFQSVTLPVLGTLPLSLVLGLPLAVMTILLLSNRRVPAGLALVGLGLAAGLALGGWRGLDELSPGLHLPELLPFGLPSWDVLGFALVSLVLPQLPMTVGNAVVANRDLSYEYFGDQSRRVTDRALCWSMGLANLASFVLGGMPMCHGAGGLAAHYRFGARTAGSNFIIGGLFLVLVLVFGSGILALVRLLPMGVLGVLLAFAGAQLAIRVGDLEDRGSVFVAVAMAGIALASNLAWGFGAGLLLSWVIRRGWLRI